MIKEITKKMRKTREETEMEKKNIKKENLYLINKLGDKRNSKTKEIIKRKIKRY